MEGGKLGMNLRIRKEFGIFLVAVAVIALIFLIAYEAIDYWDKTTNTLASSDNSTTTKTSSVIKIDGVSYTQKEHITTMLLLGIDNTGEMVSSGSYINDGQSDFITVIILDEDEDTYALLQINRDTMTDVRQLGVGGNVVKTTVMQIALSHSYGDGMEDSCENSIIAVENFLCGVSLDHYLAMNMTAVELLVDYVGGVTVTILDDFSEVDETLVEGETMTLSGSQVVTYIRARQNVGDQTNLTRMTRQQQFISELLEQLPDLWEANQSSAFSMFYEVSSYILTDMTAQSLSSFFDEICGYDCTGIYSPDGELVLGDEYYEFYADEDSVKELVIELFLEPVSE